MKQNPLDKVARVSAGVKERDLGVRWNGKGENIFIRCGGGRRVQHPGGQVGHVEARHEECGRETGESADIGFDFGFGVKVMDVGECAFCY